MQFLRLVIPIYIPTNSALGHFFFPLKLHQHLLYLRKAALPGMISHYSFYMDSPNDEWSWTCFHVFVGHWKMSVYIFCSFTIWIVCFVVSCVQYIFWLLNLCQMHILQIFSPTLSFASWRHCLLRCAAASLLAKMLLSVLVNTVYASGDTHKKSLPRPVSFRVSSVFNVLLGLMFRSLLFY